MKPTNCLKRILPLIPLIKMIRISTLCPQRFWILALALLLAGGLPAGAALRVWFKADGITGVTNGAAVTTWNDASGNGFTASYVGTAPTYAASDHVIGVIAVELQQANDLARARVGRAGRIGIAEVIPKKSPELLGAVPDRGETCAAAFLK